MKKYAIVDTAKSHRILTSALTWFFLAHRAELEEREAGMHREHHDRAKQDEHASLLVFRFSMTPPCIEPVA